MNALCAGALLGGSPHLGTDHLLLSGLRLIDVNCFCTRGGAHWEPSRQADGPVADVPWE